MLIFFILSRNQGTRHAPVRDFFCLYFNLYRLQQILQNFKNKTNVTTLVLDTVIQLEGYIFQVLNLLGRSTMMPCQSVVCCPIIRNNFPSGLLDFCRRYWQPEKVDFVVVVDLVMPFIVPKAQSRFTVSRREVV